MEQGNSQVYCDSLHVYLLIMSESFTCQTTKLTTTLWGKKTARFLFSQ